MDLSALGTLLSQAPEYRRLADALRASQVESTAHLLPDAVPFVVANLWRDLGLPVLVVVPRPDDARRLHEHLMSWSGDDDSVLHFPETETLAYERLVSDVDTVQQRLRTLARLTDEHGSPPLVVASTTALVQKTIARDDFDSISHVLRRGQQIDLDELLNLWRRMGYEVEPTVYAPGSVSRRGGILDIYPINSPLPVRIELWGNEIDSIRMFDPLTQRSTNVVESISVIPSHETLPAIADRDYVDRVVRSTDVSNCTGATRERIGEELGRLMDGYLVEELNFYAGFFNRGSLPDYFPPGGLLVVCRPSEVAETATETQRRTFELKETKQRRGELPIGFPSSHLTWQEVEERLAGIGRRLDAVAWGADDLVGQDVHVLPFAPPPTFLGQLDGFVEEAGELAGAGHAVVAMTSHSRRLGEIFADSGVEAGTFEALVQPPSPGSVTILQSDGTAAGDGFALSLDERKLVFFGDTEIFGVVKQRRTTRRTRARQQAVLSELSPGDYVVHVEHGIGRFAGTGQMGDRDDGPEYVILSYSQGDKLYVPMEHLDRVTPYVAPMDHPPTLTRLGTQEWKRAKERVARSTREMAAELLSLYAARELVVGLSYPPDVRWQAELEESFPYEETPDQLETIAQVKADMESAKPMDRLVCGDVGYGKTEIALRAAFKAVMDGRQVAMLVPTTVLAQQHYATFAQRLSAYPVAVEVLSRFRTDLEQSRIVEGLADGSVDICIGTHRLIQKDVRFKNLGLVLIDEEQRFGVAHKERLKQMRREVDVLTLTATPVPRTLHMSMAGVRDMSTMETPPEERLPIKTYVSEFSDDLIREAILRELDRQGQVYFLHNRVNNIEYMAGYIHLLVPQARVGVAHGQMPEAQLEQTMVDFADGEMDVLLCTTIIESGLDIPNVNTLIVNRADTFGLAQLYQLRGRVGRSARRAYSYLLVPKARSLTEAAERRLKAMLAATELGSGFRIAMKDLEIRGAGNILGAEQSGHIHAVGFDLYAKLLAVAVEELRAQRSLGLQGTDGDDTALFAAASAIGRDGSEVGEQDDGDSLSSDVAVDLGIPASIPQDYIEDLPTRLGIYQRLVRPTGHDAVDEMEAELGDRFGQLPWQAQNLLYVTRLRLWAQRAGVESITNAGARIVLRLHDDVGGARQALRKILGHGVEVGNTQIRLDLDHLNEGWEEVLVELVRKLGDFREKVQAGVQAAITG